MKRFILVAIILSTAVALAGASASRAESLTDAQIESIKANCFTVRNTLNQLHTSDAILRVNIGQRYESMSTKLMGRFNRRVSTNGLQNTSLLQATNDYVSSLNDFRSLYRAYEEHLATATRIDCNSKPSEFYEAIISAQEKRKEVHGAVIKLDGGLKGYLDVVNRFEIDFKAVGGAL